MELLLSAGKYLRQLTRPVYVWYRIIMDWFFMFSFGAFSVPLNYLTGNDHGAYSATMTRLNGFPLPSVLTETALERIRNFPVEMDDVFIVGFPKSGTTWLQIVLSSLYEDWGTCRMNSHGRVPLLEMPTVPGDIIYGSWLDHAMGWLDNVDDNILFITYEDTKKDPNKMFRKIVEFIGRPVSEDKFNKVIEASDFRNMKNIGREKLSMARFFYDHKKAPFFRKGIVGDWKNHLSEEENDAFDRQFGQKLKARNLDYLYQ
uniref:Estrogen sulfotransferase-like n=1 Tax=Saccoglossus kowalevskii TaxID=10224 RepID=A0ABM0MHW3_SACKO|nr:PREDICTED: estrogen sulfotransferase-like [Saccoglossus kowalevskii]